MQYLAGRTAGTIVRNAASLAGNTMLVVRHIREGTPFPSDLFTAFVMMDAEVQVICPAWKKPKRLKILDFARAWQRRPEIHQGAVILSYSIPYTQRGEFAQTYKCALREVNAHSIVNAGLRVRLNRKNQVESATIILGGIAPVAFHAKRTEEALLGRAWNAETLEVGLSALTADVEEAIRSSRKRLKEVPWQR
jgi:xanthine dehydrogenase/oxidase